MFVFSHLLSLPLSPHSSQNSANISLYTAGIPFPSKTEPGYSGVTTHEQKGADSWEACSDYGRAVHKEQTRIIQKTQNNVTDGGKSVKINKGAHHKKDGFGGSGLRGGYGGDLDAVNVLDPLLVPVQDENCGTTGPDHDHKT